MGGRRRGLNQSHFSASTEADLDEAVAFRTEMGKVRGDTGGEETCESHASEKEGLTNHIPFEVAVSFVIRIWFDSYCFEFIFNGICNKKNGTHLVWFVFPGPGVQASVFHPCFKAAQSLASGHLSTEPPSLKQGSRSLITPVWLKRTAGSNGWLEALRIVLASERRGYEDCLKAAQLN